MVVTYFATFFFFFASFTGRYPLRGEVCLRDVTLTLRAGEKVGVVGRTGAGKSSIALLLFRWDAAGLPFYVPTI